MSPREIGTSNASPSFKTTSSVLVYASPSQERRGSPESFDASIAPILRGRN